jgi:hypothetical protein
MHADNAPPPKGDRQNANPSLQLPKKRANAKN